MDFLGLTVDEEMIEHGPWFSVSVFWSPDVPVSPAADSTQRTDPAFFDVVASQWQREK